MRFPFHELKRRCDSTQRYQEGNTSSAPTSINVARIVDMLSVWHTNEYVFWGQELILNEIFTLSSY